MKAVVVRERDTARGLTGFQDVGRTIFISFDSLAVSKVKLDIRVDLGPVGGEIPDFTFAIR